MAPLCAAAPPTCPKDLRCLRSGTRIIPCLPLPGEHPAHCACQETALYPYAAW